MVMPNAESNDWARHLAWFLGPKSEQGDFFEQLLVDGVRDHLHWRRNYYPGDSPAIDYVLQSQFAEDRDTLSWAFRSMLAELKRTFPFSNPRYIAHQLSEVSMASMLGYMATMLYNPNNVTPEAAPVTVSWELEVCNRLLQLLGFNAAPAVPKTPPVSDYYLPYIVNQSFGWCHLTPGGTVANIESLWVARNLKYYPLAVRDIALKHRLFEMKVTLPDKSESTLIHTDDEQLLKLRTRDVVELFRTYHGAVSSSLAQDGESLKNVERIARKWLEDKPDDDLDENDESTHEPVPSLYRGIAAYARKYKPVVVAPTTAHYSMEKIMDILGLGTLNWRQVQITDPSFSMNMDSLKSEVDAALKSGSGEALIAVVALAGTTEAGAVDPIDKIHKWRLELEMRKKESFWLHVDAAWGGFIRSLMVLDDKEGGRSRLLTLARRVSGRGLQDWVEAGTIIRDTIKDVRMQDQLDACLNDDTSVVPPPLLDEIEQLLRDLKEVPETQSSGEVDDVRQIVKDFTTDSCNVGWDNTRELHVEMSWPENSSVFDALYALKFADSIAVDPHKLGYCQYPCGAVAFQNDGVRRFIWQQAAYITSVESLGRFFLPPMHIPADPSGGAFSSKSKPITEAFGPFILEGSRPGAMAAGLWLAQKCIPWNIQGHGRIIRASLLAARELFEWLTWLNTSGTAQKAGYRVILMGDEPPHTNIVTFGLKRESEDSLGAVNEFCQSVYARFTIDAELGDLQYSYSQPFFLSHSKFRSDRYNKNLIAQILSKVEVDPASINNNYDSEGLTVLRAAVMSPYIHPMKKVAGQNYIRMFVEELHDKCIEVIKPPDKRRDKSSDNEIWFLKPAPKGPRKLTQG